MNNITPYEQLLAQEMDHLPLPDSMENIWADIESQLDVQLPQGGGKNPPPRKPMPSRRTGRFTRNWRLFVILGGMVAILLVWQNRKRHRDVNNTRPDTTQQQTIIPDTPLQQVPPPANNKVVQPVGKKPVIRDSAGILRVDSPFLFPSIPVIVDSNSNKPVIPPSIIPGSINPVNKMLSPDSAKTPPPRKPRGLKVDDSTGYKLIQKNKDSTKG